MTQLAIYHQHNAVRPELVTDDPAVVAGHLALAGILFERWAANHALPADCAPDTVLAAYAAPVARLKAMRHFQSADVVRVPRGGGGAEALRAKFLDEHTHTEDEARFFAEGGGAFFLHLGQRVFQNRLRGGRPAERPGGNTALVRYGAGAAFHRHPLLHPPRRLGRPADRRLHRGAFSRIRAGASLRVTVRPKKFT